MDKSSPDARAVRLKRLRNIANLSRKQISEHANININTLVGWEVARHGGLSQTGAKKIIDSVAKHGVLCNVEWLMHEVGEGPQLIANFHHIQETLATPPSPIKSLHEEQLLMQELLLFKQHYPDTLEYRVMDDSMSPEYQVNDYVAGLKLHANNIDCLLKQDCIVLLNDGNILLRNIRLGTQANRYTLTCSNLSSEINEPVLYDKEIICAAPVMWRRRMFNAVIK